MIYDQFADQLQKTMQCCTLCPRECGVNRLNGEIGFCGSGILPRIARMAPHYWEEPPISGTGGSGTVFFAGCNLKCRFCQNHAISHGLLGKEVTIDELADKLIRLEHQGVHNINLVTGAHYLPQIALAIRQAKKLGLSIPVVYNSSAYEKVSALKILEGLVDVYLPDLKYGEGSLGNDLSDAPDYFTISTAAIAEMVRQCGQVTLDEQELIRSGVIIRHLVLPGFLENSIQCLRWIRATFSYDIYISLMGQYTPISGLNLSPPLDRRLTEEEYQQIIDEVFALGLENGFIQELEAASENFIPEFDMTGV